MNLHGVKPDLVLVAGARDQKFVGLAECMTQLANGVLTATSGSIAHDSVVSSCKEGVSDKPHASCYVIPNCGHAVYLERPEAVVHLLQRVLVDNGAVTST